MRFLTQSIAAAGSPSVHYHRDAINAAMTEIGSVYQLTEVGNEPVEVEPPVSGINIIVVVDGTAVPPINQTVTCS